MNRSFSHERSTVDLQWNDSKFVLKWSRVLTHKYVVHWSIWTVQIKEYCIHFIVAKFDQILCSFTYPSSWRNIETSKGYKHFTLDRSSDIIKLQNFYVGYVQYFPLIISKQIWNHFIADRPSIAHVKMNGPQILAHVEGANNDEIL